jgi:hypothetical protein
MKFLKKITNGIVIVVIAILHTQFALSADGFGEQFQGFSKLCFFNLFRDFETVKAATSQEVFENFAAFWFFYFGILLIPLGLLLHSIEKKYKILPYGFIVSYLIVVLIGCYMIPKSGMTYYMLPHAIFMLVSTFYKNKKVSKIDLINK